jgi:5-methyltetrahydrofolate--homocysteine methyltransferase
MAQILWVPAARDQVEEGVTMDIVLQQVYDAIVCGAVERVQDDVRNALEHGRHPGTILNVGMIDAMADVGQRFERGEMLIAARAMKQGLVVLRPLLAQNNVQSIGKVIIGTVKGDLHDVGKNLVAMMLEGAGFEIVDLGTDVPPEKFAEAAHAKGAGIVAMSALLTTTMPSMLATIDMLEIMGVRRAVRVMVGGAPVTEAFAGQIGADGYAPDASQAVTIAKGLL